MRQASVTSLQFKRVYNGIICFVMLYLHVLFGAIRNHGLRWDQLVPLNHRSTEYFCAISRKLPVFLAYYRANTGKPVYSA